MLPCGNPHLSNQANQMLTCVIILANLSAPIKHCHVSISSISHETLTLISATMTATPRQPPLTPVISLSLGDQITTTLATSVLPVCSEENS